LEEGLSLFTAGVFPAPDMLSLFVTSASTTSTASGSCGLSARVTEQELSAEQTAISYKQKQRTLTPFPFQYGSDSKSLIVIFLVDKLLKGRCGVMFQARQACEIYLQVINGTFGRI
jgi:hypothetical protein